MKSGVIPALSSSTEAHTLPEWEENFLSSSLVKSGWTAFADERNTSAILIPVRYFVVLFLFTKTAMGWESDWPSCLARRKILYAARTGQISGRVLSAINVMDCPFCLFFCILKVTRNLVGNTWTSSLRGWTLMVNPLSL